MHACLNKYVCVHGICYYRSAAHSAQWQDVELTFCRPTLHRNRREKKKDVAYASLRPAETFMLACLRPMEAACFRVQKCANNRQLIVAGIQMFVGYAYAACFRIIYTIQYIDLQNAVCARYIYANNDWCIFCTR